MTWLIYYAGAATDLIHRQVPSSAVRIELFTTRVLGRASYRVLK